MAKPVKRWIAQFFLSTVGIYLVSLFMPEFYIDNLLSAMFFTLMILLLMFLFWPLLLRWVKRFLFLTFVVGSFLLSAFVLWLANIFLPGVIVSGWGLVTAPIAVDFVSAIIIVALNIDDDDVYSRSIYYRLKQRMEKSDANDKPGFIFLGIDGLSERVLRTAIEKGAMPTLADWLKNGSHKIKGWETDLSSQTGAGQAGILHGCNKDIPAFRWVDKSNDNKIVSSNGIGDAPLIQKQISDGNGLLSINGASIVSLFTGDSKDNIFVYSVLKNIRQLYSESWSAFYSRPFNGAHVAVLLLLEVFLDIRCRYRQWKKNIQPRLKHTRLSYFIARVGANVLLREISTYTVIGNVIAGEKDTVYTTYLGYDEVAHHYGVTDNECFDVLKKLDRQIHRIDTAKKYSKRFYHICILSDHGQTNGATFKQRYGLSLNELVKKLLPEKENIYQEIDSNQDHFDQAITIPSQNLKRRLRRDSKEKNQKEAKVIVLASGNLGLIYFTKWPHRMTLEEIELAYPTVMSGLLNHEGIGFLMVRSQEHGPLVLSAKGRYYLANDKIEGENPLTKFGENAAVHLRRTDSFNYVPDILVMSLYDPAKDEVAAFEELIGSHGGLGGDQSRPFIMYPSEWNLDNENIIGSEKVYKLLKNKIDNVLTK